MKHRTTIESKLSDRGDCGEWTVDCREWDVKKRLLLLAVWIVAVVVVAEDVTVTLDPDASSAFVVLDSQSNILTTVWADGRTVAGGGGYDIVTSNTVANGALGPFSTVSGGLGNLADSDAWYGSVGGGYFNGVYGSGSAVGGGVYNTAYGAYGTVPGGIDSHASGDYSFAAGRGALATNSGTFVWADSTPAYVGSTVSNQFIVRASGGTKIFSNADASVGVQLIAGGNSWSGASDRNLKENFSAVDHQQLLAALDAVPMTTWNMKSQDDRIRHIGPMAQDFHAAFGVGAVDTHISYSDADGVSLAAVQGLYRLLKERDVENRELRQAINLLEARVEAIELGLNNDPAGGGQ